MPNGNPRDRFFYPTLTLMMDSYMMILSCYITEQKPCGYMSTLGTRFIWMALSCYIHVFHFSEADPLVGWSKDEVWRADNTYAAMVAKVKVKEFIWKGQGNMKIQDHIIIPFTYSRERSGSVVDCLTRDRGAAGSSLTDVTALWTLSKTHLSKLSTGSTHGDPSLFN